MKFFSSVFCHALFRSRKFCETFSFSAIDFCLQDSIEARENVNLQEYAQIITDAVLDVIQDSEPLISVAEDYFQIETANPITAHEYTEINRVLASSMLGKYQTGNQPLFSPIVKEDCQTPAM